MGPMSHSRADRTEACARTSSEVADPGKLSDFMSFGFLGVGLLRAKGRSHTIGSWRLAPLCLIARIRRGAYEAPRAGDN